MFDKTLQVWVQLCFFLLVLDRFWLNTTFLNYCYEIFIRQFLIHECIVFYNKVGQYSMHLSWFKWTFNAVCLSVFYLFYARLLVSSYNINKMLHIYETTRGVAKSIEMDVVSLGYLLCMKYMNAKCNFCRIFRLFSQLSK